MKLPVVYLCRPKPAAIMQHHTHKLLTAQRAPVIAIITGCQINTPVCIVNIPWNFPNTHAHAYALGV